MTVTICRWEGNRWLTVRYTDFGGLSTYGLEAIAEREGDDGWKKVLQRYACAVSAMAVCPSVRPSVCLSQVDDQKG